MNVSQAIKERRSIKAFDPQHKMTEQEISTLMSLAMLSPTAFNIQNWRFVLVTDPVLRHQIRAVSWNQAQVQEASLLIVLTADLKAWAKKPERYWQNAPKAVADILVPAIGHYYENNEQVQRDEAMRSCGMAAMTIMLAAKEMGYDTCPMDGFDFDAVAKLLNLPADHTPTMFVVVGKALKDAQPRGGQLTMSEVVINDKF
ncbi:MAG: nitroreductase family protein [Methylotenera sp.]|uniref:nitroreductase family protein n=1 Tax=Methylotenera sp. TaxID=2051956 RepID=UPI00271BA957|nr:nitroreductase family protein [Methylotenera sp.]MDO9394844.1 nitroreductase family protein [Methylotenera sp.]MDP2231004.1 nitroreductase family protein [Methylotenera sp.]MDP3141858.1 nitroreductase family protein [Methylotenera sp.]MDP3308193.1 nitroreductase family protein [Methylotenera sp.]